MNEVSLATSFATSYAGVVAFMTVATQGSFAKAGDRLGIGRSSVSRSVQKLEAHLGVRLMSRTTRRVALTREGEIFHARCLPGMVQISQALEELRDLREGSPRGSLRIAASVGFGRKVVAPLLWGFQARYPDVAVDLVLSDAQTYLGADRIDVAFRNGRMEDSQLVAKPIVAMQMLLCASPAYLQARGMPQSLADLARHDCINLRLGSGRLYEWEFKVDGELRTMSLPSRLAFNDAELVLQAVLQGQGIGQLAGYQTCGLLREGKLVYCLPQFAPDDRTHFICYLSRQPLPSRIRAFVEHMTVAIRALDLAPLRAA